MSDPTPTPSEALEFLRGSLPADRGLDNERDTAIRTLVERLAKVERDPHHPESKCQNCGGNNIVWWIDSDRWNHVTEAMLEETGRGAILCPACFVRMWEFMTGLQAVWHLVPEGIRAAGPAPTTVKLPNSITTRWDAPSRYTPAGPVDTVEDE